MKVKKNKSIVVLLNENKGAWIAPTMVSDYIAEMPCLKCVFAGSVSETVVEIKIPLSHFNWDSLPFHRLMAFKMKNKEFFINSIMN